MFVTFSQEDVFQICEPFVGFFLVFFGQKPQRPNAMKISHSLSFTLIKPSITGCLVLGNSLG